MTFSPFTILSIASGEDSNKSSLTLHPVFYSPQLLWITWLRTSISPISAEWSWPTTQLYWDCCKLRQAKHTSTFPTYLNSSTPGHQHNPHCLLQLAYSREHLWVCATNWVQMWLLFRFFKHYFILVGERLNDAVLQALSILHGNNQTNNEEVLGTYFLHQISGVSNFLDN